jgi:ATP-binding cassette subfamily G (WHITE) protein 2
MIGGHLMRGVSGGERKRTSIGVELLKNPLVLFLDEPTSGLDSLTAKKIIALCKSMTESGKTVACTIHQPSSQIYALFDNLIICANKKIAYQGPANTGIDFFRGLGAELPDDDKFNPAEELLKVVSVDQNMPQSERWKREDVVKKLVDDANGDEHKAMHDCEPSKGLPDVNDIAADVFMATFWLALF